MEAGSRSGDRKEADETAIDEPKDNTDDHASIGDHIGSR